jgi:transketolase
MAIAEKWLAHRYNRPGFELFNYQVYAEGVAPEAAALAGHLGLDNLCWIFDNDHITIEGNTSITFTEDVATRFLSYGWDVQRVSDANDIDRLRPRRSGGCERSSTKRSVAAASARVKGSSRSNPRRWSQHETTCTTSLLAWAVAC